MQTESITGLFISALILVTLIINIQNSRRFNFYDRLLHHKLVKNQDGLVWKVIALLNEPKLIVVWDFALAGALALGHHYWAAFWALGTLAFTDAVGILLKHSVKRKRPLNPNEARDGYSFPSGHVLSATIMCLVIWKIFGSLAGWWLLVVLVASWLLVVISRLNMRAHYPSDVLGATSLAIFCFYIVQSLI